MKTVVIIAIAFVLMIPITAFGETFTVTIPEGTSVPECEETNECYLPADLTINVGDTVEWVNVDTAAHTVTGGSPADSPSGVFDSSLVMGGATYSFTFHDEGSYDYFCMLHPWMVGNIIVTEKKSPTEITLNVSPNYGYDGDLDKIVVLETNLGKIVIEFFPHDAPYHVENFINLTESGFYDGTVFHRIISDFMIQGGDPKTKPNSGANENEWGTGNSGKTIDAEFNTIKHNRGIVSMARSADPNSASSQFFIVHKDSNFLDEQYTVFGRLVTEESFETLDKIATVSTGTNDRPVNPEDVRIIKIELTNKDQITGMLELGNPKRIDSVEPEPISESVENDVTDTQDEMESPITLTKKLTFDEITYEFYNLMDYALAIDQKKYSEPNLEELRTHFGEEKYQLLENMAETNRNAITLEEKALEIEIMEYYVDMLKEDVNKKFAHVEELFEEAKLQINNLDISEEEKAQYISEIQMEKENKMREVLTGLMSFVGIENDIAQMKEELEYETRLFGQSLENPDFVMDEFEYELRKIRDTTLDSEDIRLYYSDEELQNFVSGVGIPQTEDEKTMFSIDFAFKKWNTKIDDTENTREFFIEKINSLDISESEKSEYINQINSQSNSQIEWLESMFLPAIEKLKKQLPVEKQLEVNSLLNIESICGEGTIEKNGQCVIDTNYKSETSSGGGCLIATATFDSELAPQVQKLREIRDSKLLQTESGTQFMEHFNSFYYSFSPIIADYERENPYFKEIVKVAITPMLSTLSLMDYAETDSQVLGIGISLIILNLGMYVGVPVFAIMRIRK